MNNINCFGDEKKIINTMSAHYILKITFEDNNEYCKIYSFTKGFYTTIYTIRVTM